MSNVYEDEIAILIPCLNESQTIASVVSGFRAVFPTASIYVFDNRSDDDTSAVARDAGATVISVAQRGKGAVVREMFRRIDAQIFIMVDGDNTYLAEDAPKLLETLIDKQLDMVVGDRLSSRAYDKQNKRRFHGFGNRLVLRLINALYGSTCSDILSGYRVFSRRFIENCPILVDGFEVETQLTIHAVDKKLLTAEVPIQYRDRPEGSESKLSTFRDGIRILKTIAMLFKDYKPLHFFSAVALVLFILGLFVGGIPISEYVETGLVTRFPLAILAAAIEIIAVLAFGCGLLLDTFARNAREQYELRIANFSRQSKLSES